MKIALTRRDALDHAVAYWSSTAPFVRNDRAALVHRPRSVTTVKLKHWPPHLAIHFYCGNASTGKKNFHFVDALNADEIVCARCETEAMKAGLPSSFEIIGRHVHIGGVKVYAKCCDIEREVIEQ